MKKILIVGLLALSTTAFAHGPHGYWRPHPSGGWNWVAPAVIGGVIGYEVAQAKPPIVVTQPSPVAIQQPPVIIQQNNCSPWTQIRNPDGTVTVTRTCTQ